MALRVTELRAAGALIAVGVPGGREVAPPLVIRGARLVQPGEEALVALIGTDQLRLLKDRRVGEDAGWRRAGRDPLEVREVRLEDALLERLGPDHVDRDEVERALPKHGVV